MDMEDMDMDQFCMGSGTVMNMGFQVIPSPPEPTPLLLGRVHRAVGDPAPAPLSRRGRLAVNLH